MNLLVGNAHDLDTRGTGWFIGFGDWTRGSDLLHVPKDRALSGLCVKWYDHAAGDASGNGKPVSEGRSISILVSGDSAFRIEFSESADFPSSNTRSVMLRHHGDFVAWGEGLYHRWHCIARSTIMTLRWNTLTADDSG